MYELQMTDSIWLGETLVEGIKPIHYPLTPQDFGPLKIRIALYPPFKIPDKGKRKLTFKTQRNQCKNHSKNKRRKLLVDAAFQRYYAPLFNPEHYA